jgi:hypothetical protein
MRRLLSVLAILALIGSIALAAPRTWKSSNGRFSIEAELLDFKDGKVQLKKSDGTIVDVPLLSLSAEDQQYVKKQFPGADEERFRPGAQHREWKSKNGKFGVLAEFVGCVDERVQLRKPDGTEMSVELKLLSDADQRWVAEELRRLSEEEKTSDSTDKTAGQEITEALAAQDIEMKLLRLDQPTRKTGDRAGGLASYLIGLTEPQQFFMQVGDQNESNLAEFHRVVQKEPKYEATAPFRGVARFGSRSYGFALDAVRSRNGGYNRLYFDANGDGDLTDDKFITASAVTTPRAGLCQSQFPRVDVKLDVGGKPVEYGFLMIAICQRSRSSGYATVSLYAAAAREGFITQGNRRIRLVLLDRNSNGCFNDAVSCRSDGVPNEGDILLINPNEKSRLAGDASMSGDRNLVGKIVCLGKEFYRLQIPPAGDRLKLTPANLPLGDVSNASPAYRAVLFSDNYGVVIVSGTKDRKIPLPEGDWKILSYTIDAAGFGRGPRTGVAATFRNKAPTVSVHKAQTAQLGFGAPFRAVVTAARTSGNKVVLSLAIVGVGGEQCTSVLVKGGLPPQPRFVIKNKEDKIVHRGVFEYG